MGRRKGHHERNEDEIRDREPEKRSSSKGNDQQLSLINPAL
ncbi:hypothetical protein [Mesobacillus foraminis]|nr:hypothetical protein [Mesobacillus foraminis]